MVKKKFKEFRVNLEGLRYIYVHLFSVTIDLILGCNDLILCRSDLILCLLFIYFK